MLFWNQGNGNSMIGIKSMLYNLTSLVRFIVLLPLLFSLGTSRAQEANQRILFISDRDGSPQLYVMNADGTGIEQFVDDIHAEEGGRLTSASLSPDGTLLAFSSRKDRVDNWHDRIFLMDMRTGIMTPITDGSENTALPVWSPDSTRIAYFTGSGINGYDIVHVFDVANAQEQPIIQSWDLRETIHNDFGPAIRQLAWSPDGQQIMLYIQTPQDPEGTYNVLILLNSDGTDPRQITPNEMSIADPAWGSAPHIVFALCDDGEQQDICRLDLATGEIQTLVDLSVYGLSERLLYIYEMDVASNDDIVFQVASGNIYWFRASDTTVTRIYEGVVRSDILLEWINLNSPAS
jgi:Tol biopolymer transport system component